MRWHKDCSGVDPNSLTGWRRIKCISLGESGAPYLTLGGSIRDRFEGLRSREFGFAEGVDNASLADNHGPAPRGDAVTLADARATGAPATS